MREDFIRLILVVSCLGGGFIIFLWLYYLIAAHIIDKNNDKENKK